MAAAKIFSLLHLFFRIITPKPVFLLLFAAKALSRRKKEKGRRKKTYTASFLASRILPLIRWIY
ncbi:MULTISPECIES: hypothetical protein [unclassified Microcoleus]|uniref:hypothetical protein n=1 Tax=unclassified Microcoleus TaxID=2642155 RepID=UPI002FD72673